MSSAQAISTQKISIVMMGATGAVGSEVVRTLLQTQTMATLTLLGRSPLDNIKDQRVSQHKIDIFAPDTYSPFIDAQQCAICTLGVGQPSKMAREDFIRIDKTAALDFATKCKQAGVSHFQLLSSVGVDDQSKSFFLRTKGELQEDLKALNFDRLTLIEPSMILTPKNRYGLSQGILQAVWPWLGHLMAGPLKKFRGVPVETLGRAIAINAIYRDKGNEVLHWADFNRIAALPVT